MHFDDRLIIETTAILDNWLIGHWGESKNYYKGKGEYDGYRIKQGEGTFSPSPAPSPLVPILLGALTKWRRNVISIVDYTIKRLFVDVFPRIFRISNSIRHIGTKSTCRAKRRVEIRKTS